MDYGKCMQNLLRFQSKLTDTGIKFLFFYATDLSKPKIKDVFKKWNDKYVLPGETKNNIYVYRESVIKYIISNATPTGKRNEYDVKLNKKDVQGEVNHGNHINFGIRPQKDKSLLVLSHRTEYFDPMDEFNFIRSEYGCNFKLYDVITDKKTFANINHIDFSGSSLGSIGATYTEGHDLDTIYKLCQQVTQGKHTGGSRKTQRYIHHGNKRCLVGHKRGKCFINTGVKDVYLQKGGAAYKGITFLCDKFIAFLAVKLFQPLHILRSDLISIQLFFDEFNEVCPRGNQNFVLMYDFETRTRNIFYIDFVLASVSCYANDQIINGQGSVVTEEERECLREFNETYPGIQKRQVLIDMEE